MPWDDHATPEDHRVWRPVSPLTDPPAPTPVPPVAEPRTLPSGAEILLQRLDAWAERMIATHPALAEAVRRDHALAERESAADDAVTNEAA